MCIDTGKVPEGILDLGTTHAITVAVAAEVTADAALSVPKIGFCGLQQVTKRAQRTLSRVIMCRPILV